MTFHSTPLVGWICNCKWPSDTKPDARPVLIGRVWHDLSGEIWVLAIYGTGQRTASQNSNAASHELEVLAGDPAFASMGLQSDTKFNFKQTVPLRWEPGTFGSDATGRDCRRGSLTDPQWKADAIAAMARFCPKPGAKPTLVEHRPSRTIQRLASSSGKSEG